MPFGLYNTPSAFQDLIDEVHLPLFYYCCANYIEDILIYSKSTSEHLQHFTLVMTQLKELILFFNLSKRSFF